MALTSEVKHFNNLHVRTINSFISPLHVRVFDSFKSSLACSVDGAQNDMISEALSQRMDRAGFRM
ncbi:MAG: hypothetical protein LBJ88_02845 [Campylobacteraceae bacterium]|nr:hypothetical protein [Campylobacteraceae bacterium]